MEAIRCEGLTKRFGAIAAVDNLNLAVEEGRVFGFLGPNGAGKTTTVKLLTGLARATSGRAWVAGEAVSLDSLALRAKVGVLPEEPSFYPWMTGRELLAYVGEIFHLSSQDNRRRVEELLELVGLEEAASRRIGGYSRGMRQRLGIAQALVNRPPVLFLDEPCSALDPIGRREILEMIRDLREEATIFMSTHILSDVERVCDVVGIIDRGRLVAEANIDELKERFARPIFELQFEEETQPLARLLANLSWVNVVEGEGNHGLRVRVNDLVTAKRELPKLCAESGLTLVSYHLTSPSLEDVFMELVKSPGGR